MKKFLRTADASGNIVNAIPGGIGYAIVPSGKSPGGFPTGMTVDFTGTIHAAHPVLGPDPEFFKDPFVIGHIRGATPNRSYLCYSLSDRREATSVSTQTSVQTQLVGSLTDTGQGYNVANNDPGIGRNDNGVGALGLDIGNASFARVILAPAAGGGNFLGGKWYIWYYDYDLGLWLINGDFVGNVPAGVAYYLPSDQPIGVGWGRIYPEFRNVTQNGAPSGNFTVYMRVGRGA